MGFLMERAIELPGAESFCSTAALSLNLTCRRFHLNYHFRALRVVSVPPFAESITEGDIVWKKAVGDHVNPDEVVAEIETDKTSVPVHAPCAGIIKELLVDDGGKVVAGQEVLKIEEGTVAAAAAAPSASTTSSSSPPPSPSPPKASMVETTVADKKESPTSLQPPATKVPTQTKLTQAVPSTGERGEQRVKMSRMRLRIAQRLKDAQNTCAMLTTFNEIDMTNMIELRRRYKDAFEKRHGIKLGIMSTFAKASAVALQDQPVVNAVIDGGDIIYRDYIDISIAVATPKGLVVPVLHNVEKMSYYDIEHEIIELGKRARDGTLAVEDMDGGTFTISNGGVYGSLFGTPIINPPQSAILGMYGVFDRPVAKDGQVVVRPMMYVALTYDHRLIDGREAVTFLRKIKQFVEDPRTFFLQI
ncbi:hypothetical protein CRM22_003204 [Opisthorchis felineus]|uniref:Dihydrolipoyllysine-residue succinyltransferase component of 2-oxoglutarate dehydrogenase complex, mitochondrial n=1 Tax=Opisthorchis felineus TaxID=147828 RepID=A0A4S2M2D7_OPIFE|nr:hypothetical protein CRM22_003204 [Opisthorchis felineus]